MPRLDTVLTDCSDTWGRGGGGDVRDLMYEVVRMCADLERLCEGFKRKNMGFSPVFFWEKNKKEINEDPKKTPKTP